MFLISRSPLRSNRLLSQIENVELATAYNDASRKAHSDLDIDLIQIRNRPAPVPQRQLGGIFTCQSEQIPSFGRADDSIPRVSQRD
jgi:hypothetical protein